MSNLANTLETIYRRWMGIDCVRDDYARLARKEVWSWRCILELESLDYELHLSHES